MIVLLFGGRVIAVLVPLAWDDGWTSILLLASHQLFSDALIVGFLIHDMSLHQTVLPQAVLGRANASFHVVAGLLMPAGAAVGGVLASTFGMYAVIWTGVVGGLVAPFVLLASPVRRLSLIHI